MGRPNVLLIVLDAVRPDHLSCYGYERETSPEIDRLAEEGVRYRNAFSNANWTPAAHPPIFTGQLPSNVGVYGDHLSLPAEQTLLPERLSAAGYRTFGASAGAHIRADRGYDRGFEQFLQTHRIQPNLETLGKMVREPAYRKQVAFALTRGPDDKTVYKFEALKRFLRDDTDPTFAFLNCKTAHFPYNPPRPFKSEFCPDLKRPRLEVFERLSGALGRTPQRVDGVDVETCRTNPLEFMADAHDVSEPEWEVIKSWYDGSIRYLDYRVGRFVEELRERGTLENTYLIVTADHGEMFGEKGLTGHSFSLHDSLLSVPLIVRPPGGADGRVESGLVSLVDLFDTILDVANATRPERPHSRCLRSEAAGKPYVFAGMGRKSVDWLEEKYEDFAYPEGQAGPVQSIRDGTFKLIRDANGDVELYRWREDPEETVDVGAEHPDARERLLEVLEDHTGDLDRAGSTREPPGEELQETLEYLGYR